jgi:hypothetical protein
VVMSMMEAGWCFCANVTPTLALRQTRAGELHLRSEDRRAELKSCHGFGGFESKGALSLTITTAVITVACYTYNPFHLPPPIIPHSHSTPHHIITMFPRRFAQSMQAAAKQSSAAPARIQRAAFVSQQFTPAVSQRLSGMRMYSDAPAAEAKKTDEATADKDAKDAKVEEDPVKAELETKKKELLEATVRLYQ